MELTAKIALVTGGGVRIGRALVLALAEAGCSIFLHYGNSQKAALEVQAEVEALILLQLQEEVQVRLLSDADAVSGRAYDDLCHVPGV